MIAAGIRNKAQAWANAFPHRLKDHLKINPNVS